MERFHSETTTLTAMTILLTQTPTVVLFWRQTQRTKCVRGVHTNIHKRMLRCTYSVSLNMQDFYVASFSLLQHLAV